jgi:hypothetical protein
MTANRLSFYQSTLTYQKPATWQDYLKHRDNLKPQVTHYQPFFYLDQLIINDIGREGMNHAEFWSLITIVQGIWSLLQFSELEFTSLGGCLIEKPETAATAPDLVLYMGKDAPYSQEEVSYIDLNRWRVPDLVGEVSDTTLAVDLDEKKQLYSALKIPEYWVIGVRIKQVLIFILQENGKYLESDTSQLLIGLKVELLNQTLAQLEQRGTKQATRWFYHQIMR